MPASLKPESSHRKLLTKINTQLVAAKDENRSN
jgi:hypothetical protein